MAVKPIFIFAVARTGSTLVQRVVAAHDGLATTSEPWLLLPHAYTFRRSGVLAEYPHATMVEAIEDFCDELPGGADDYRQEVHDSILRLYEKAAGDGATHFLDKSPYSGVAEEVMSIFPEGKFIFLWRNPLSIVASNMATWDSKWKPSMFRQQLYVGLPRLAAACEHHADHVHSVRFEDLVRGEERHWRELMDYLEIEFDPSALERFSAVTLNGRMGDPIGVKQYSALNSDPVDKWRKAFANPLRKEWCRRYLRFLNEDRLATMGYDGGQILAELELQPTSMENLMPDLGRLLKDVATEPVRVRTRTAWIGGPNVIRELLRA